MYKRLHVLLIISKLEVTKILIYNKSIYIISKIPERMQASNW